MPSARSRSMGYKEKTARKRTLRTPGERQYKKWLTKQGMRGGKRSSRKRSTRKRSTRRKTRRT